MIFILMSEDWRISKQNDKYQIKVETINLSNAFHLDSKVFMDYAPPALILTDDNLGDETGEK